MSRRMRHLKPREIQGCDVAYQFWRPETLYDATSGGSLVGSAGSIARVEDVSGNNNHATQGTSGARPTRQIAARGGLDAARFDGTDDFLNAGDVADMLGNPVECYAVFIRNSGSAGIFGKSKLGSAAGRWSIYSYLGNDYFLFSGSGLASSDAPLTTSTSLQLLHGYTPRGNTTVELSRNAASVGSYALTDTGASQNTEYELVIGGYQGSTGTMSPAADGLFLAGDVLECGKWAATLSDHTRKRAQHAAMRRARIAG